MSTQITHITHTQRKGYLWRKRYDKSTIEIALQANGKEQATQRAAAITVRFMELEALDVPFTTMRETLKAYRDKIIKADKLTRLQALASITEASESVLATVTTHTPTISEKMEQETLQREIVSVGHSLEEAKESFFNASTEWAVKTRKDYSGCIDRFIVWCTASSLTTIESIKKENIVSFKAYMDEHQYAPNTKQKILNRLSSLFKHCVDVMEWIDKNPITGMMYRKVEVVNKKEEITAVQFQEAVSHNLTTSDLQSFWAMQILYHCGLRVSELTQLKKGDYRVIEGIKCISINNEGDKTVKNAASIRNIPLNDALLSLNIWEKKPTMKYGDNRTMDAVTRAFRRIELKRSTHCFRHSLSNRLRDTNADDSTRAFILGHSQSNITDRVYISRLPLQRMKEALDNAAAI